MQPPFTYLNPRANQDINIDEGRYSYIDFEVIPKGTSQYEKLKYKPQDSGTTSSQPNKANNSSNGPSPAQSDKPVYDNNTATTTTTTTNTTNRSCGRPPCWGWAVLIIGLVIAAVVTAILVVLLTSNSENLNATSVPAIGDQITSSPTTSTIPASKDHNSASHPKNCEDVLSGGGRTSSVYSIYPDGQKEVRVFCEQALKGGGWTVFQRRMDGSVNFYQYWVNYKAGFGDPSGEYWLGNDNLHILTNSHETQLLVELESGGQTQYAQYLDFWVLDEGDNYQLHVSGYAGGNPPGDSLTYHNSFQFTTLDNDNDAWSGNCAQFRSGGWWYKNCHIAHLNGVYNTNSKNGIIWSTWRGFNTSMSAVRMMLKTR